MFEEQAINDCIEGFIAGYPLCCILEYANISYRGGLWAHLPVTQTRGRGYQGYMNYNRVRKLSAVYNMKRYTINGLGTVLSDETIDLNVLECNNFVMCSECSKKYENHYHYERCPTSCPLFGDKTHVHDNCYRCGVTPSCDPVFMELEKWAVSP